MSKEKAKLFDTVLFLEPKLEQRLWPVHCIMNSWGAQLHKDLYIAPNSEQVLIFNSIYFSYSNAVYCIIGNPNRKACLFSIKLDDTQIAQLYKKIITQSTQETT